MDVRDAAARVRADDQERAAVRVHVVRAILGVVLGHEDRHVLPERAVRKQLDQFPQRQVVVGDVGGAVGIAFGGPGLVRVVVGQPDADELGQRLLAAEIAHSEFALKLLQAVLV